LQLLGVLERRQSVVTTAVAADDSRCIQHEYSSKVQQCPERSAVPRGRGRRRSYSGAGGRFSASTRVLLKARGSRLRTHPALRRRTPVDRARVGDEPPVPAVDCECAAHLETASLGRFGRYLNRWRPTIAGAPRPDKLPFPESESSYVAVVDTFMQARSAANARNASDFLAVIAAPEAQLAFSKVKALRVRRGGSHGHKARRCATSGQRKGSLPRSPTLLR
jgi:hypothetical protein